MPIAPAIPTGGLAGLRFLDQTYDRQFETFNKSPEVAREITYFQENASKITTLDDLMADRRILGVVLGAFGLDEDLNKGAFIRKVIEDGTLEPRSFANRLADPAYRQLASFVGFGNFEGSGTLILEETQTETINRYKERRFEQAVGDVNVDMRLVLNFRRDVQQIAGESSTANTVWLRLMGSPPLRSVLEGALNLPSEFAAVDIDQQVEVIADRAKSFFGIDDPRSFTDDDVMKRFVDRFVTNSQITQGLVDSSVRGATALSLLQSSGIGSGASQNLFNSNLLLAG